MSSLLARFAANAYWLGRYLERAESLARILDTNETYARDHPAGPNWERILDLYADHDRFLRSGAKPDAESILYSYTLDRDNPTSILHAVSMARENTRTIRHLVSTEMWTHLNTFHHRLVGLTRRDIWTANLAQFCSEVKVGCQSFEGIAEGTFFREEAWCFYQLGKYIERADQTTRVLDMGYDRITQAENETLAAVQRDVLVRSVSGYHAFRSRFPTSASPRDIVVFLLYDERFPRAVTLCANQLTLRLRELERRHGKNAGTPVEKARRALEFALETGIDHRITSRRLHRFLDDLQIALGQVSDAIGRAYFG